MSVLVKGMEMPECCDYCPFEYKNYCMAKPSLRVESADRHPDCPLVPVPAAWADVRTPVDYLEDET